MLSIYPYFYKLGGMEQCRPKNCKITVLEPFKVRPTILKGLNLGLARSLCKGMLNGSC